MGIVKIKEKVFEHDAQQTGFDPNTHVDLGINYLRLISSEGENRILEGIRGTGKTHIMKMVSHNCLSNFKDKKILPIYVSLAGLPQIAQENKDLFSLYFSQKIINEISNFLLDNKDLLISEKEESLDFINILKNLFGFSPSSELEENFNLVQQITKKTLEIITFSPDKLIERIKDKKSENFNLSIGSENLNLGKSNNSEEELEKIAEYTLKKFLDLYSIDLLLKFLVQIKRKLSLSYVYLLIDECSETKELVQKETLRICKRIRGIYSSSSELTSEIAFMIAVYPTQYYPSISKGDDFNFEPGNDCTIEYLELDELSEEYESFFDSMMENRLKRYNDEGYRELKDIFENGEGKALAAYAAGGVPRRYLEIMKQAYDLLGKDYASSSEGEKKIGKKFVSEAIQKVIDGPLILKNTKLTKEDNRELNYIVSRLSRRNKTTETKKERGTSGSITLYFVTSSENENLLANLINAGIIHDKKRSRSRKTSVYSSGTGTLYGLDFGVAFHRGVIYKQRALEIARKDLKESSARGFQYVLDIKFEDESLDEAIRSAEQDIRDIEKMQMRFDNALISKELSEERYELLSNRYKSIKEKTRKIIEQLKSKRNKN